MADSVGRRCADGELETLRPDHEFYGLRFRDEVGRTC